MLSLVHLDTLSVEPLVRRAPNGDLIVISTCGDIKEPGKDNRVYMFRSKDNGKTFDDGTIINPDDNKAYYSSCFVVVDNCMYVFISSHNGQFVGWENYILKSTDSGYTFMIERLKSFPKYAFVRNMAKLSDGRLLFNYHAYPITEEMEDECLNNGKYIMSSRIKYVDNGILIGDFKNGFKKITAYKMKEEDIPVWNGGLWIWNWTENATVELEKGHLAMLFRVDKSNYLHRCDSYDFGQTWEKPYMTDIPNPGTKVFLDKTDNGDIILINSPNNEPGFYLRRRFPFEVWISNDNMKTWYKKIQVSDYPGAYSYPDGFVEDGHLKFVYDFNRHDIYYCDIDISK